MPSCVFLSEVLLDFPMPPRSLLVFFTDLFTLRIISGILLHAHHSLYCVMCNEEGMFSFINFISSGSEAAQALICHLQIVLYVIHSS